MTPPSAFRSFAPILLLFVLLGVSPGVAGAFDLGVRAGYGSAEGDDEGAASIGVYTRIDIPGPVNLELAADGWTSERSGGRVEARNIPLTASALLYPFPSVLVKPYLLGGAGITMVRLKNPDLAGGDIERNDHLFTLQAGAGLDIPLPLIVLTADLRYLFTEELDPGGPLTEEGYRPGGWRLSAGAAFKF